LNLLIVKKKILLWRWYFRFIIFSLEINTLLKKSNNVISQLIYTIQKDFGDVFTVVYNQVYEELRTEEIEKEKIERK
jgi:hypothetical protein